MVVATKNLKKNPFDEAEKMNPFDIAEKQSDFGQIALPRKKLPGAFDYNRQLGDMLSGDKNIEDFLPWDVRFDFGRIIGMTEKPDETKDKMANSLFYSIKLNMPPGLSYQLQDVFSEKKFGKKLSPSEMRQRLSDEHFESRRQYYRDNLKPFSLFGNAFLQSLSGKPAMALRGAKVYTPGEALGFDWILGKTSEYLDNLHSREKMTEVEAAAAGKLWPIDKGASWYKIDPKLLPETINAWSATVGDQIPIMLMTLAGREVGKRTGPPVGKGVGGLYALITGGPEPTDIATALPIAKVTEKVVEHLSGAAPLVAMEAGGYMDRANAIGIDSDIAEKYARQYGLGSGTIEYAQWLWNLKAFKMLSPKVKGTILKKALMEVGGATWEGFEELTQQGLENYLIGKAIEEQKERNPGYDVEKPETWAGAKRSFGIGLGVSLITRMPGHAYTSVRRTRLSKQIQEHTDATKEEAELAVEAMAEGGVVGQEAADVIQARFKAEVAEMERELAEIQRRAAKPKKGEYIAGRPFGPAEVKPTVEKAAQLEGMSKEELRSLSDTTTDPELKRLIQQKLAKPEAVEVAAKKKAAIRGLKPEDISEGIVTDRAVGLPQQDKKPRTEPESLKAAAALQNIKDSQLSQAENLLKNNKIIDRGKEWRKAPYAYKNRFAIVNSQGFVVKEAPTAEKAIKWMLSDLAEISKPKTPEQMSAEERIEQDIKTIEHPSTGEKTVVRNEDIISVVSDELQKEFGWPQSSNISEATYFETDDGKKIRVAAHSVVYGEDVDFFIGIGKLPDADISISKDASVQEIKDAAQKAIALAKPEAVEVAPEAEVEKIDADRIIEKIDNNTILDEQAISFIRSRLNEAAEGRVKGLDIFAVGALKTATNLSPIIRKMANAASNQMSRVQSGREILTPEKLAAVSGIDTETIKKFLIAKPTPKAEPAKVEKAEEKAKLRQKIQALADKKGMTKKALSDLKLKHTGYRTIEGKISERKITTEQLENLLKAVQKTRPRRIGHKKVITKKTEKKIQSLKENLIKKTQMTERHYDEILEIEVHGREPKYIDAKKFITETQGKDILKRMLDTAEIVRLTESFEQAIAKNPEIADQIKLLDSRIEKSSKRDPYSLESMRYYNQQAQIKTGAPIFTSYMDLMDAHLDITKTRTATWKRLEKTTAKFKEIAKDEQALKRVSDYIASQSRLKDKPSMPKDITPDEKKLAQEIQKILKEYRIKVRVAKFYNWYYYNQPIPQQDRYEKEINKAVDIYESKGREELIEYLETQEWGVIKSGYEPLEILFHKIRPYTTGPTAVGKGHVKIRTDIEYHKQERNILQRLSAYMRQIDMLYNLSPKINAYVRLFDDNAGKFSDWSKVKNDIEIFLRNLKRYNIEGGFFERIIARAYSQAMRVIIMPSPVLSFRNLFQNAAFEHDKSILIDPRNTNLTKSDIEYLETYVLQTRAMVEEYFMVGEKPVPGLKHLTKLIDKVKIYPYSDIANRHWGFWAKTNQVERALKAETIKQMMTKAKFEDMKELEQRRALAILARDGKEAMRQYIGRVHVDDIHFLYERAQRSPAEMTSLGKIVGNLMLFPRAYGEKLAHAVNKTLKGKTSQEQWRGLKTIFAVVGGGLIVGSIYTKVTGRKRNPYDPLEILTFRPGGLAWGSIEAVSEVYANILSAAKGDSRALAALTVAIPRAADMFIPFYDYTLRAIEAATDQKNIDRKVLRQMRMMIDKEYKIRGGAYKVKRTALEKWQYFLSGPSADIKEEEKARQVEIP